MDNDYTKELHVDAAPQALYAALTTVEGCSDWWAPASGSAAPGGELRFTFDDPDRPLVLRVAEADPAGRVAWHVTACEFLPDWAGTTVTFLISAAVDGGSDLRFRHVGLSPVLECFDQCQMGWNHFLPSLRAYAETGAGYPYRAPAAAG